MSEHKSNQAVPFINVTPLIDVLLVLLIIFMVISPARPSKFESKIPDKPKPGEEEIVSNFMLVVSVNRDSTYSLNRQPANTLAELETWLHLALDGRPDDRKAVLIKAPRTIGYGQVVKVIDVMKAAGSASIGLQIENLDQ